MSKELDEALKFVKMLLKVGNSEKHLLNLSSTDIRLELIKVEKALTELQSIKEANPSEALKCLEKMYDNIESPFPSDKELYDNIKQALLKAQEPKHYLKWEDLVQDRTYKVLLNGIQYELVKRYDDYEYHCDYITLQKKPNVSIYIYEYEKEIFNDLHLERVEE